MHSSHKTQTQTFTIVNIAEQQQQNLKPVAHPKKPTPNDHTIKSYCMVSGRFQKKPTYQREDFNS